VTLLLQSNINKSGNDCDDDQLQNCLTSDFRHGPMQLLIALCVPLQGDGYENTPALREGNEPPQIASERMATVEVRLPPAGISARIDEIRRWLNARALTPVKFTSTGSSNETVLLVEFSLDKDAEEFAREFSGVLLG
jgi:hypothetical protein